MYKQQANMPKQIEEQIERLCKQQSENKRLEQTMSATEADLAQVSLTHTPSPGLSLSHTHMSATEADLAPVAPSPITGTEVLENLKLVVLKYENTWAGAGASGAAGATVAGGQQQAHCCRVCQAQGLQ